MSLLRKYLRKYTRLQLEKLEFKLFQLKAQVWNTSAKDGLKLDLSFYVQLHLTSLRTTFTLLYKAVERCA